jgi:hypothetical protein
MNEQIWKAIDSIERMRECHYSPDKESVISGVKSDICKAVDALNQLIAALINTSNSIEISMQKSLLLKKYLKEVTSMRDTIIDITPRAETYSSKTISLKNGYRTSHTQKQLEKYSSYILRLNTLLNEF